MKLDYTKLGVWVVLVAVVVMLFWRHDLLQRYSASDPVPLTVVEPAVTAEPEPLVPTTPAAPVAPIYVAPMPAPAPVLPHPSLPKIKKTKCHCGKRAAVKPKLDCSLVPEIAYEKPAFLVEMAARERGIPEDGIVKLRACLAAHAKH